MQFFFLSKKLLKIYAEPDFLKQTIKHKTFLLPLEFSNKSQRKCIPYVVIGTASIWGFLWPLFYPAN